ncbi:MAG: hypothetical protein JNM00_01700, partial [Flavobacteriales bacterium]|nr:hypothetical protein [Flavobacteriales bacterium]
MKRILFACFFAHASALVAQIHFDEAQSELALWDTVSVGMVIKPAGSWDYSGSTRKNFSALGKYENLDVSQVFTLCMDKHQNVWIGGGLGEVVRYNGRTFEYFTLGCFSTNPIYKIFEDAEGNMWFGSLADGLVKYDGHHCMRLRPGAHFHLETIGVFDITGDPEGVVWISTNGNGLIGIKGDRVMRIDAPSPLADHSVTCSAIDDEHSLWCGYYNAGISCLGNGTALHFDQNDGLVSNKVFALYNWQGRVLAGTRNGLYICSAQNGIQLLPWSQGVFVFDMSEDQDNNLWIATNGSGLVRLRYTGGTDGLLTPEWFTEADGLLNNRLLDVMCDNDGNVWLGTFGNGVVRHSPDLFTNFDTGCGLPSDKIWSMTEVAPEEIWVGTSRNGLARVLPDTCLPLDLIKDIRQTDVHDIIRLRDGRFCFSASGQGIYLGGDKKWKKIPFASGLSLQTIMDICETTEAHGGSEPLFLASFNGILQVRNDSLRLAQFANGTMQLDVNAIVADNDALYWAASSNGLWCIHRKQPGDSLLHCTQLPVSSGLQGQKITAVNVTHTHLYAGTQGSGVR